MTSWGRVLHDDDLAHAIIDRVLERGRMLALDGPSHRTKHLGLDDAIAVTASPYVARFPEVARQNFRTPQLTGGW